jgi:four helix bundle protein
MINQGFKKLEIYQRSHKLAIQIHEMTLTLPKFEIYEEGSQIRRSSKSIPSNIVEGYCLGKHKNEFLLYLNRSYASAEETNEHLKLLFESNSLKDENSYKTLRAEYEILCMMVSKFIQSVSENHTPPLYLKEDEASYNTEIHNPQTEI